MSIDPFAPAKLGPLTLRNRFIKAATFEGLGENNLVSERLVAFHRTMAAGGLGMTTIAYVAVSEDGQGAPNEIVVRPEALPGLRRIADAVHAEGAAISAQIGHAGPVSASIGRKALAPSRQFSPMSFSFTRAVEDIGVQERIGDRLDPEPRFPRLYLIDANSRARCRRIIQPAAQDVFEPNQAVTARGQQAADAGIGKGRQLDLQRSAARGVRLLDRLELARLRNAIEAERDQLVEGRARFSKNCRGAADRPAIDLAAASSHRIGKTKDQGQLRAVDASRELGRSRNGHGTF